MGEPTREQPSRTPFAPPGGARPAPAPWATPGDGRSTSPYAPPGDARPPAPYGVPLPPAPPAADAFGSAYAVPPASAGPPPYGTPPPAGPGFGYGTPPPFAYGTPPPFGYGPPVEVPTDGLATASLATGVVGLVLLGGLPGPVGVGLGIGALRRIRRRGTRGRGLAVAGVVVGAVGTLACAGWVWLAVWASSNPGVTSGLASEDELPDYTLRSDLAVGDCLPEYPGSWDLGTAGPVDCAEPHALQIVAVLPLSGPVDTFADPADPDYDRTFEECTARIDRTAPGLVDEWVVWTDVSFPHPDDWSSGATTAYCAVATDDPTLRGSVLDGSATGPG